MEHEFYLGIDVGKTAHHATGITANGTVVRNKPLPQSDPKIRELLQDFTATHRPVLVVWISPRPWLPW